MSARPPPMPMQQFPRPPQSPPPFAQPAYPAPPSGAYPAPASGAYPPAQPQTSYAQPPTGYPQPPTSYAQPPSGYTQPPTGYQQPPSGYAQPPNGYAQPPQQPASPTYGSPYNAAPPAAGYGYGQPAPRPFQQAAPAAAPYMPSGAPGQNMDYRLNNGGEMLVLNPPAPYVAPKLDSTLSSRFIFQNNSMRGHERNFTVAHGVTADELKQFFMANSAPPDYRLKVIGWHMEKQLVKDANGNESEQERRKEDWTVLINPTKWIKAPGNFSGLDDGINNFLRSSKSLRKVTLHKRVNLDINGFLEEVRRIVGSRGWNEQTEAHIVWENHSEKLAAHGAGGCHNVCDSTACKCLLFATCLCICWSPMKALCFEDHFTIYQDLDLSVTAAQLGKAVQNDLPQSFRGMEAEINKERREEQREKAAYDQEQRREQQERERAAERAERAEERREERQWEQQEWQQQMERDPVILDVQVTDANGRREDELIVL